MDCIYYRSCKQNGEDLLIKIITLLICGCLIVAFFLSTSFILSNANHEHDHDGPNGTCLTCIQLAAADNLLKQLFTTIVANVYGYVLGPLILLSLKPFVSFAGRFTLITLKVQINN